MELHELKDALQKFFSDTSRSAQETKDGLNEIADEAYMLAESIPDEDGDDDA